MNADEVVLDHLTERINRQSPRLFPMLYRDVRWGPHRDDTGRPLVQEAVIVWLKTVEGDGCDPSRRCVNDLRATGLQVCLLLDFGDPRLEIKTSCSSACQALALSAFHRRSSAARFCCRERYRPGQQAGRSTWCVPFSSSQRRILARSSDRGVSSAVRRPGRHRVRSCGTAGSACLCGSVPCKTAGTRALTRPQASKI